MNCKNPEEQKQKCTAGVRNRLDFKFTIQLFYFVIAVRTKSYLIFLVLIFTAAVFDGCFAWNYISDGYQNFSAYFNTYYNGQAAFEDGLKEVKSSIKEREIALISGAQPYPFVINEAIRQKFYIAIEKASKVLQLYPSSEFTENCLFIIGICDYYEGDNIGGQRKFNEIEATFPKSSRYTEAEMYLGLMRLKSLDYDAAFASLNKAIGIAEKKKNMPVAAKAAEGLSDYFLSQNDTTRAAVYLDSAATFSTGDEAAIYACKEGSMLVGIGDYVNAKRAYEKAYAQARDVRLRFYSKYYLARVQRMQGKYYSALGNLNEIRDDDKFFQYFPLVDYQESEVLYDSGAVSSAVTNFQRIDTAYASNEAATRSAFKLGNIYLYTVGDYQTALRFFQRCAVHPSVYTISPKAQLLSGLLQEYFIIGYRVQLSDSLYTQALHAAERNDSAIAHSQVVIDTLYEHAADARQSFAGFFLFKLQIPDSAIAYYKSIVHHFQKSKAYSSSLYTLGEYYYSAGDTAEGQKYLTQLLQEHPESHYADAASSLLGKRPPTYVDSSRVQYDRAMDLEKNGDYDSAVKTLDDLLKDQKLSIAPQVLYAAGWIYENKLSQPDSAYVYYKQLATKYPSSNFSANVTLALTGYEQAERDSALARSLAKAKDSTASSPPKPLQPAITPQYSKVDSAETVRRPPIMNRADSLAIQREQLKELIKHEK